MAHISPTPCRITLLFDLENECGLSPWILHTCRPFYQLSLNRVNYGSRNSRQPRHETAVHCKIPE